MITACRTSPMSGLSYLSSFQQLRRNVDISSGQFDGIGGRSLRMHTLCMMVGHTIPSKGIFPVNISQNTVAYEKMSDFGDMHSSLNTSGAVHPQVPFTSVVTVLAEVLEIPKSQSFRFLVFKSVIKKIIRFNVPMNYSNIFLKVLDCSRCLFCPGETKELMNGSVSFKNLPHRVQGFKKKSGRWSTTLIRLTTFGCLSLKSISNSFVSGRFIFLQPHGKTCTCLYIRCCTLRAQWDYFQSQYLFERLTKHQASFKLEMQ